jgi:type II/III secretion system protein
MLPARRALASCLTASLLLLLAAAAAAQAKRPEPETVLHAFALQHQQASDAVPLVNPLLSPYGTVELQPQRNTLVIRDTQAAVDRILPVLRGFDHPARPLRLEIYIVRASRAAVSPAVEQSDLPEGLTRRLRLLLPYEVYRMQAQARLRTQEGEKVFYDLSDDYRVSFRLGTVMADGRIKLNDFQIERRDTRPANLIHTHLTLWLERTTSLGLAKSEESKEALMVVLTLRGDGAKKRAARVR